MSNDQNTPFIFYLTLEENLPKIFFVFDKYFRSLGYILLPVRIDQLQLLISSSDQNQVIVITSVQDAREMKLYNDKVRKVLKFVLKSKRLTFMHLSSFSKVNDSRSFSMLKNYFFIKYPIDVRALSAKIARYYDLKSSTASQWPGGRRAGLGAIL